MMGALCTYT